MSPDQESTSKGWWQTLPGVLTAGAAIITAVTGLLVALHQAGFFDHKAQPPAQTQLISHPTADNSRPVEAGKMAALVPQGGQTPRPLALPEMTQVRSGDHVFKLVSARLETYSPDKVSLRLTVRMTNNAATRPISGMLPFACRWTDPCLRQSAISTNSCSRRVRRRVTSNSSYPRTSQRWGCRWVTWEKARQRSRLISLPRTPDPARSSLNANQARCPGTIAPRCHDRASSKQKQAARGPVPGVPRSLPCHWSPESANRAHNTPPTHSTSP